MKRNIQFCLILGSVFFTTGMAFAEFNAEITRAENFLQSIEGRSADVRAQLIERYNARYSTTLQTIHTSFEARLERSLQAMDQHLARGERGLANMERAKIDTLLRERAALNRITTQLANSPNAMGSANSRIILRVREGATTKDARIYEVVRGPGSGSERVTRVSEGTFRSLMDKGFLQLNQKESVARSSVFRGKYVYNMDIPTQRPIGSSPLGQRYGTSNPTSNFGLQ